jgi:hypothetical protein
MRTWSSSRASSSIDAAATGSPPSPTDVPPSAPHRRPPRTPDQLHNQRPSPVSTYNRCPSPCPCTTGRFLHHGPTPAPASMATAR